MHTDHWPDVVEFVGLVGRVDHGKDGRKDRRTHRSPVRQVKVGQTDREAGRQKKGWTDRQTGGHTDGHSGWTDRQADQ